MQYTQLAVQNVEQTGQNDALGNLDGLICIHIEFVDVNQQLGQEKTDPAVDKHKAGAMKGQICGFEAGFGTCFDLVYVLTEQIMTEKNILYCTFSESCRR